MVTPGAVPAEAGTWRLNANPAYWLVVSASDSADLGEWRAAVADLFGELFARDEADAEIGRFDYESESTEIGNMIDKLLGFASQLRHNEVLVAHLSIPGRWPIPVIASVSAASSVDPDYLMDSVGAKGGMPIAPPDVQYFSNSGSDSVRVTRFDLSDDQSVLATVAYARRELHTDISLVWRTTELDLIPVFTPHLDDLLHGMTVEPCDG